MNNRNKILTRDRKRRKRAGLAPITRPSKSKPTRAVVPLWTRVDEFTMHDEAAINRRGIEYIRALIKDIETMYSDIGD